MLTLTGVEEVKSRVGQELGVSDWHEITQDDINEFAEVTGDHQWIHVDVERATQTPFGGTIAHGFYVLSLAPTLSAGILSVEGFAFMLNYGLNRVRFPAPMPVGGKLRIRTKLTAVDDVPGGVQIIIEQIFEREGGDKPVCVAEAVTRAYTG